MAEIDDILFGREGGVATVTLNRPQALNAFTLDMYRRFDPMLRGWADDPAVHAVVIRGAGGRAFCAGGDIRAIYEAGRGISGDRALTAVFFRGEYQLLRQIHRWLFIERKPLAIIRQKLMASISRTRVVACMVPLIAMASGTVPALPQRRPRIRAG